MISLNTNILSQLVQRNMKLSTNGLNLAIERMTTGLKINHAKDDAAGFSIAQTMNTKLSSYAVALDNADIGLSYLSTAEGNLDLVSEHLIRIRDLTEQAANGTYSADSRQAIQAEIDARLEEINRIIDTSEYNGQAIFKRNASATFSMPMAASETSEEEPIQTFAMTRNVAVEEAKRVSKVSSFTSGQTYYITDSADLVALQDLVNAGISTAGVLFELANNVDMSGVEFTSIGTTEANSFQGSFNGNGNIIANLTINDSSYANGADLYLGLFGYIKGATIYDIYLRDVNIEASVSTECVGGLVAKALDSDITSCYVSGSVNVNKAASSNSINHGGFVGSIENSRISNSASYVTITSKGHVGGFCGIAISSIIENCSSTGDVTGKDVKSGGFIAHSYDSTIRTCVATGDVWAEGHYGGGFGAFLESGSVVGCVSTGKLTSTKSMGDFHNHGAFAGCISKATEFIVDCQYNSQQPNSSLPAVNYNPQNASLSGLTALTSIPAEPSIPSELDPSIEPDFPDPTPAPTPTPDPDPDPDPGPTPDPNPPAGGGGAGGGNISLPEGSISFFVGINGNAESMIAVDTQFTFALDVDVSTVASATAALAEIDVCLSEVNKFQTEIGTVSNRLESVIESLQVNIETLASSLSTVRDADIAKESTRYLQQQILQNACATLLSTANQTPSVALALINGSRL